MARHETTQTQRPQQHNTRNTFTIWQWNCRGYRRKRALLQQFLRSRQRPDVILLQETNDPVKLAGYKSIDEAVTAGAPPAAATLVRRNLTVAQRELMNVSIPHVLIELIPTKGRGPGLFVLNVYSRPKARHRFSTLLREAREAAADGPLLIAGDFNAPHAAWGYGYETPKGKRLWDDAQNEGLELITDPSAPTRRGNSVCADTSPDLTFTKNVASARWHNTQEDLGSDHSVIEIQVDAEPHHRVHREGTKGKNHRLVDWDAFRKVRKEQNRGNAAIEDIDSWTATLKGDLETATREVPPEAQLEVVDSKLLHMWEAKRSLQDRWKRQRHNRTLRRRIARLSRDMEEHALQVCKTQWEEICNGMENQLGRAKTWHLLRHLLDPEETKTSHAHKLNKLLHDYKGTHADFLDDVRSRYFQSRSPLAHSAYAWEGEGNAELDEDFSVAEVRAVLHRLNTKSAPGPDGITNKALRNLDDESIEQLTAYMNECWNAGAIPNSWKTARIIMIPKPGKRVQIDNLRPISLTSCVGKVMEHVVLARLTNYLEDRNMLPHTMLGFRRNLSTQDVMLQLKHDIVDNPTRSTKAILGLDLKKAFDNVSHAAILESIRALGLGERTYHYVRDFLTGRRARLAIGGLESQDIYMGCTGTPQGSVISPMLFNLVLVGLPRKLAEIEGLHHSLYADDITLWVAEGNDGHVEQTLQEAVDVVQDYLRDTGLECSAAKSELLLYRPSRRGRKPKNADSAFECAYREINVRTSDGAVIPQVNTIRVLGLRLSANGHNGETVRRLEGAVNETIRLLKRITNRHSGMKESNTIRLVHAFVMNHITYVASYLKWQATERTKLDCLIRKAYKRAIGLPANTSTEKFLELGLHNTLDEIIEAHNIAQYERLAKTRTGRHILETLGINYHTQRGEKVGIPRRIRERIVVMPLPKNMHPTHHIGRRNRRAQDLEKKFGNSKDTVYVDAARYDCHRGFAVAITDHVGTCVTSATIGTEETEAAEEAAIALAIATTDAEVIIGDSQAAIRNYASGRISREAARILQIHERNICRKNDSFLVWTPAHTDPPLAGNATAHAAARGLTRRAATPADSPDVSHTSTAMREWTWGDRMTTFRDITQHYRLNRCKYPPPHAKLNKKQQVAWRQLQTHTYPNPVILRLCYPGIYTSDACKACGARATLQHMLWKCTGNAQQSPTNPVDMAVSNREARWEAALLSHDLADQLWAVRQAQDAARVQGLEAVT